MDYLPRIFVQFLSELASSGVLSYVMSGFIFGGLPIVTGYVIFRMLTSDFPKESIEAYEARVGRNTRGRPGVL